MKILRHADAGTFLEFSQSWLLRAEPDNNLMLGIARRSAEGQLGFDPEEYWATVLDDDEIVGTSFRTPPYHLAVSQMPARAIAPLATDEIPPENSCAAIGRANRASTIRLSTADGGV